MGVPYNGSNMAQHPQYITVRNARGRAMLDCLGPQLQRLPAVSKGDSRPLVMQVCNGVMMYCKCCHFVEHLKAQASSNISAQWSICFAFAQG